MRDPVTRRTGLCHRDLHPRQLLDDGARVMIVDLDQVGRGHPALDLANFRAYLTARIPHHCVAIEEAFLAGYAARTRFYFPGDDVESEAIYRAFTFLRLAVKTCRGARTGWECTASELLDSGERSLFGAEACL
jgi:Ser/Thr protein kinase RdoA (MazF antagonist)